MRYRPEFVLVAWVLLVGCGGTAPRPHKQTNAGSPYQSCGKPIPPVRSLVISSAVHPGEEFASDAIGDTYVVFGLLLGGERRTWCWTVEVREDPSKPTASGGRHPGIGVVVAERNELCFGSIAVGTNGPWSQRAEMREPYLKDTTWEQMRHRWLVSREVDLDGDGQVEVLERLRCCGDGSTSENEVLNCRNGECRVASRMLVEDDNLSCGRSLSQ